MKQRNRQIGVIRIAQSHSHYAIYSPKEPLLLDPAAMHSMPAEPKRHVGGISGADFVKVKHQTAPIFLPPPLLQ
jgi:hypothetical protein